MIEQHPNDPEYHLELLKSLKTQPSADIGEGISFCGLAIKQYPGSCDRRLLVEFQSLARNNQAAIKICQALAKEQQSCSELLLARI